MILMTSRMFRSRRKVAILCIVVLCVLYYFFGFRDPDREWDRERRYIEKKLEDALKLDKGTGCEIPKLDPFSKKVTRFDKKVPKISCPGKNWVECYHTRCRVVDDIKESVGNILCRYQDIIYKRDFNYTFGPTTYLKGGESYELIVSDHVKVACTGKNNITGERLEWSGVALGFRKVTPLKSSPDRENSLNVLMFAFDSTSRNGFIRRMPKSWKVLTQELGATVMENYNIVDDGTLGALFPILTGKTELEQPDVRRGKSNRTLDGFPFIFKKLKADGYRTAYFEDAPSWGTFQWYHNGFLRQPADHYLHAFNQAEQTIRGWRKFCVGGTQQFKLMMNITEQFMDLGGKRFVFTIIADITHYNFNYLEQADDDTAEFLRAFRRHADNTLLVFMGDHGTRYSDVRSEYEGKMEERLPLMALLLPPSLVHERPSALSVLRANAHALTTPHDLHATILDVLGMRQHWNPYKVRGADLTRGLTMLELIPRHRSCSEAGIMPHWCACANWQNVSSDEAVYERSGAALLAFINNLLTEVRSLCVPRTLLSVDWVLRQRPNSNLISYYMHTPANENYQIKITTGPGLGVFEATMTYVVSEDKFHLSTKHISRTTAYKHEPDCVSATHPHLNKYCYCNNASTVDGSH